MLELELVLPCYNESRSIKKLIERASLAATKNGLTSDQFQLVLVENGSKDNSSQVMDELKSTELGKWFRKVVVIENQGYGFGLWSGLKTTTANYVGWSHADEQCDPNDAIEALALLKQNPSTPTLIKGIRHGRNWKDIFVSRTFEFLAWIFLGFRFYEINAQPKIFPRSLLTHIQNPPFNFTFDLYVLYHAVKNGYKIKTIPVLFPPRIHGVSNWASNFFSRYKTILGVICYMRTLSRTEGRL